MRFRSVFAIAPLVIACLMGCSEVSRDVEQEHIAETSDALLQGVEQAHLLPNEPNPDGHFGWSVAIDGNTAALSMKRAKPPLGSSDSKGAVFLYDRLGSIWSETAYIPSPNEFEDEFGDCLALDGDLLAIGVPYSFPPPGAALVYVRTGVTWALDAKIVAQDGLASSRFGSSVALSGNTLLVQDPDSEPGGAAYVFVRKAGSWTQEARIAWDEKPLGKIALFNDTLVIADFYRTRIFTRTGTTWSLQANLDRDWSAQSMALDNDTLAFAGSDRVSIYSRAGTSWAKVTDIWPSQHVGYGDFGAVMAMDGQRAVIGTASPFLESSGNGHVYTFGSTSGKWAEEARVREDSTMLATSFGAALAVSGNTLLVGAPYEDNTVGNGGAAYLYDLVPGLANGAACVNATECASGFCTDGVCCDVLCAGTCIACTSAKKGQGADGVCGPIAAGSDPDAECIKEDPNTCGSIGECNGSGACEVYAAGTACDDNNACTENDICTSSACSGTPRQCELPDACHLPGQCNISTGECEYPLLNPKDPACSPQPAACGCSMVGARQTSLSWTMTGLWFLLQRRKSRRRVNRKSP